MPTPLGRSLQHFGNLYPAEERLLDASRTGQVCKLYPAVTPDKMTFSNDNFVRASFIRFLAMGGDTNNPVHESGVQLEGAFIGAMPNGELVLDMENDLDLANCMEVLPLFLRRSRLLGDIILKDAQTQTIDLEGSVVDGGIQARGAIIQGSLYLRSLTDSESGKGFHAKKGMNLVDATIHGSLECHNATFGPRRKSFWTEEGTAIFASRVKIDGSVFLQQTFSAGGPTVFRDARIGGNFECSGGQFERVKSKKGASPAGDDRRAKRAIDCQGAKIGGGVFFRQRDRNTPKTSFKATGEVCFIDAQIGGSFECHGAEIHNLTGHALICSRMNVTGTVFLHEGFSAKGRVSFRRATIGGHFECSGGTFQGSVSGSKRPGDRLAINCQGAKIGGSVNLRKNNGEDTNKPFTAIGEVRFIDAKVAGSFECHGARIRNPATDALACSRIEVGGSVLMIDGFFTKGEVSFRRADVRGNFDVSNAKFLNKAGKALSCESIHVTGDVLLGLRSASSLEDTVAMRHEHFVAHGQTDFSGSHIEGNLDAEGGHFLTPEPRPLSGAREALCKEALILRRANIAGALQLGQGSSRKQPPIIWGSLDVRGAKVSMLIDAEQSWPWKKVQENYFPSPAELDRLVEERAKPKRRLAIVATKLRKRIRKAASQRFNPFARRTKLRKLNCRIYMDGFSYNHFGGRSPLDAATRRRWLLSQPDEDIYVKLKPQPFEQLIKVLHAMGYADDATRIAMYREGLRKPQSIFPLVKLDFFPTIIKRCGNLLWRYCWWKPVVGWAFGYGYRWNRALNAAILYWFVCALARLRRLS